MATRAEWVERVERWERSGLSAEKFAGREGYKPKHLYWWRWRLRADAPSQRLPVSSTEAPRFLWVRSVAPKPVDTFTPLAPLFVDPMAPRSFVRDQSIRARLVTSTATQTSG
ncbi:IS66 family insertion sequence element accessory protein TnpA [Sorangium sp. So ce1128]